MFLLLLAVFGLAHGKNILLVPGPGSPFRSTLYYGKELADRGHKITLLVHSQFKEMAGYDRFLTNTTLYSTYIYECGELATLLVDENGEKYTDEDKFLSQIVDFIFSRKIPNGLFIPFQEVLSYGSLSFMAYIIGTCAESYQKNPENAFLRDFIKNESFDMIITDPLDVTGPLLSWEHKVPVVYNARWGWNGDAGHALTGSFSSFAVNGMIFNGDDTDKFTIIDRMVNVFRGFIADAYLKIIQISHFDKALNAWSYTDSHDKLIASQGDLWLMRYNFLFEVSKPLMPNQLAVGAFKCKPGRALTAEYEDFIKDSDGVIIISFGSMIKTIPDELSQTILSLIRELPSYRFIWRNKIIPENSPPNLKTVSWIPQVDLLADERTKVFISHCGNHGAHEALFNGVPILALPIMFDQFYIASRIRDIGAGLKLMPFEVNAERMIAATKSLLTPIFQNKLDQLKFKMQKQPIHDLDKAITQMEYLMDIGGFEHLKSNLVNQNFIEKSNIDVYVIFLLIYLISLIIFLKTVLYFVLLIFGKKTSVAKKNN